MKTELLLRIAETINANSKAYQASVLPQRQEYYASDRGRLVKSQGLVLCVRFCGKATKAFEQKVWNIFECELDKIAKRTVRRDKSFAERLDNCALTPYDIEVLIRRATFRSLRLKIASTSYDDYFKKNQ